MTLFVLRKKLMFEIKEQHLGFFSISWFASAISTHPSIKTNSQCTGKSTLKSMISSSNYKAMRITIKSWLGLGSIERRSQGLESTPAAEKEHLVMTFWRSRRSHQDFIIGITQNMTRSALNIS